MAVMDEFKQERQALKDKPLKDKFIYFLDYYKWYVIIGVVGTILIFTLVRDMVTSRESALYGIFVNAFAVDEEASKAFLDGYAEYAGIDLNEMDIIFDSSLRMSSEGVDESSMSSTQMIMIYTAAQDLDILSLDEQNFSRYANNEYMMDLSTCLTPEQMEEYKEYLYYVDLSVIENIDDTRLVTDETYVVEYPDPSKPEAMEKPVAVGINLKASPRFSEAYIYAAEEAYIGIIGNSGQPENAKQFLQYLFS